MLDGGEDVEEEDDDDIGYILRDNEECRFLEIRYELENVIYVVFSSSAHLGRGGANRLLYLGSWVDVMCDVVLGVR